MVTVYGYDAAGNRTTLSTVVAGKTNTATYNFDALNRMASVTDNDGNTISYTFDANSNQTRCREQLYRHTLNRFTHHKKAEVFHLIPTLPS